MHRQEAPLETPPQTVKSHIAFRGILGGSCVNGQRGPNIKGIQNSRPQHGTRKQRRQPTARQASPGLTTYDHLRGLTNHNHCSNSWPSPPAPAANARRCESGWERAQKVFSLLHHANPVSHWCNPSLQQCKRRLAPLARKTLCTLS